MKIGFKKYEKGMALLQAMMAVAFTSGVVALLSTALTNRFQQLKLESFRNKRNEISATLQSYSLKAEVINASSDTAVNFSGNKKLRACLGLDYQNDIDAINTAPKNCDETETSFILIPGSNHDFGNSCKNGNLSFDNRDMSCFLAGDRNGSSVGYNFKGEAGIFSENFPLQAKVFFRAYCPPRQTGPKIPCAIAETIDFRIQLVHEPITVQTTQKQFNTSFNLGKYPKDDEWLNYFRVTLIGNYCNTGAVASEKLGKVLGCKCYPPYRQRLISNEPAKNANGPLCDLMAKTCPTGSVLLGRKADGTPICDAIVQDVIKWNTSINSFSYNPTLPSTSCAVDTNLAPVDGWISKIKTTCTSHLSFKEKSGAPVDVTAIAVGAGVGAAMAVADAAIAIAIGAMLGPLGLLAAGLEIIIAAAIGALIAYFSQGSNWHLEAQSNNICAKFGDTDIACPEVICVYDIECSAFQ